jgi:hypothetical protein
MANPRGREDLSKFLVHLTRKFDAQAADDNLISILRERLIHARNVHCLFKHELSRFGFTALLSAEFNTVCFTEAPLMQLRRLTGRIPGRQIALQPYGLVFNKDTLLTQGANPAIYLNAKGTRLREYLLARFRADFHRIRSLKRLKQKQQEYYRSIVQYYSLVNIIRDNHDFTWEREWRKKGSFPFRYIDVVAIIAADPDDFEAKCKRELSAEKFRYIEMLPIISPYWNYEDIVETMSAKVWNNALAERRRKA